MRAMGVVRYSNPRLLYVRRHQPGVPLLRSATFHRSARRCSRFIRLPLIGSRETRLDESTTLHKLLTLHVIRTGKPAGRLAPRPSISEIEGPVRIDSGVDISLSGTIAAPAHRVRPGSSDDRSLIYCATGSNDPGPVDPRTLPVDV